VSGLQAPGPLPRDAEGSPVFAEPWQAQAFALVVSLHEAGHFTWPEWTRYLSAELQAAAPDEDDPEGQYYRCWLRALERLAVERGLVGEAERRARTAAWDQAARNTPHGQPIVLDRS